MSESETSDLRAWQRIEWAPRDGRHILAIVMDGSAGFGYFDGLQVPVQTVVHYWSNPGEEGFYTSVNELEPERPFPATHWKPLPEPPTLRPCGCLPHEHCKECY